MPELNEIVVYVMYWSVGNIKFIAIHSQGLVVSQ